MWSWWAIDWAATEGCGVWAGAVATAGAVFLAARLGDRRAARDRLEALKQAYRSLGYAFSEAQSLMHELSDTAHPGKGGITASPPPLMAFDDMISLLGTVPLLQLTSGNAARRLITVRQNLIQARELRETFGSGDWMDAHVSGWTEIFMRTIGDAAEEARLAAERGIWPHKNRAGEWIFTES